MIPAGGIFGEIALLDGQPRTADAFAVSDCELMQIDRRDFVPLVTQKPEIALKLIAILCARIRRTSEQVEDMTFLDLPGRLAKTLLWLLAQSGSSPTGKVSITQREIGQIIGMSRESTNKQLREWEDKRWLKLERGGVIVLDPRPLAEIVDAGGDGED
jgi:CRP/FNR family transcriptional regulator, cyclic AMP receptor protein